jgi:hypothetical protein
MNANIEVWWKDLNPKEKPGIITLGVIISGVVILYAGIKVGQLVAQLYSLF